MTYIYDIYLNFKDIPFDFYDWNKSDSLTHFKKIPIFIVSSNIFINIMNYTIKLEQNMIKYVYKKAVEYNNASNKINCALFTDRNNIIAILFDDNGISIKRSFLEINEELEILDNIDDLDEIKFNYNIINKIKYYTNTRNQLKVQKFITDELKKCENERLKYIYFECFNSFEKDINKIKKRINKILKDNNKSKNIYQVFKITSTKQ